MSYDNLEIHKSTISSPFVSQRLHIKFLKQIAANTHKTGLGGRKSDVGIALVWQILATTNTEN